MRSAAAATDVYSGYTVPAVRRYRSPTLFHDTTLFRSMFLPSLGLAMPVLGDHYTGIAGGVWLVGRQLYAHAYWADAEKRGTGMWITFVAFIERFCASAYGVATPLL